VDASRADDHDDARQHGSPAVSVAGRAPMDAAQEISRAVSRVQQQAVFFP
jgi:hypothetical protein